MLFEIERKICVIRNDWSKRVPAFMGFDLFIMAGNLFAADTCDGWSCHEKSR